MSDSKGHTVNNTHTHTLVMHIALRFYTKIFFSLNEFITHADFTGCDFAKSEMMSVSAIYPPDVLIKLTARRSICAQHHCVSGIKSTCAECTHILTATVITFIRFSALHNEINCHSMDY